MKKSIFVVTLLVALFGISEMVHSQSGEPWSAGNLMEPEVLAGILNNPKSAKPVIFNIGPLADIKGAINIGSTANAAGLEKFGKALASVPKDKIVVIYCGCCPFRNCPNIRPAFKMMKDKGYKNPRLLNLSQNLKVDWIQYGYPMN